MSALTRKCIGYGALAFLMSASVLAAYAGSIPAKAAVAQLLLEHAWAQSQVDGERHRPWPWAEHWPVGRLHFPSLDDDHMVLEGDAGNVLAFAPGRNRRSGPLGGDRTTIISAHRDTHFRRLGELKIGDAISIETRDSRVVYRVREMRVVDARKVSLRTRGQRELILVTCWPFDAVTPGGPQRFLVIADAD